MILFIDINLDISPEMEKWLQWGIVIFTIVAAVVLSKVTRHLMTRFFKQASAILKLDHTKYNFLKNAVSFIIYLAAAIIVIFTIPRFRSLAITLFAGAGVFAAILALASQQAFSNIISGIFIVIFKPFRVDDMVNIGQHWGYIEDITLRHTVIRNFENRRIIIPNSVVSTETILNSTIEDEKICNFIFFSISFDSDIELAIKIIREQAMQHKNFIDNRSPEEVEAGDEAVVIRVLEIGEYAIKLRASVWSKNPPKGFVMKCDLNKSIKKEFDNQGIEIPFPYRTIQFKNSRAEN